MVYTILMNTIKPTYLFRALIFISATFLLSCSAPPSIFNEAYYARKKEFSEAYAAFKNEDYQKAFRIWKRQADEGYGTAQEKIGVMYHKGLYVEQDYKQAIYWYSKAAEDGYSMAMQILGTIYEEGKGVKQDDKHAAYWYQSASMVGNIEGTDSLRLLLTKHNYYSGQEDGDTSIYSSYLLKLPELHAASERFLKDFTPDSILPRQSSNPSSYAVNNDNSSGIYDSSMQNHNNTDSDILTAKNKDTTPPKIYLAQRDILLVSNQAEKTIQGHAEDASGVAIVTVNGEEASLDKKGNFSAIVYLKPGNNKVVIQAFDVYKNKASKTINLKRGVKVVKTQKKSLSTGEYHGLLIGVEDYRYKKNINDLRFPLRDVRKMKNIMSRYSFESKNIRVLKNPTREEIIKALTRLEKNLNKQDNLLIFFAGHGYLDKRTNRGYWFPRDAERDNRAKWLSNSTIRDHILSINTRNTLLISDACFSGSIFEIDRNPFKNANEAIQKLYNKTTRVAITSGENETVPDNSVFMKYLIKQLEDNKNKYLRATTLLDDIKEPVMINSPNRQEPLWGRIRESGHVGGDFIFVRSE